MAGSFLSEPVSGLAPTHDTGVARGKRRATMIGFSAVLMWALLAVLTIGSTPVPPLQLNAICFAIGGAIGLIWMARGAGFSALRGVSWTVYVAGTLGLFGYHFLYFTAIRMAPYAETGLIAYLWPLFIVLLSGLLPGERLRAMHVVGAVLAFAGAALILMRGGAGWQPGAGLGMALAFVCAVTWAVYSVASRRFGAVPSEAVTVYCLATAVLSLVAHIGLETTVWPADPAGWLSVALLGLGPVGLAFFTWDVGMKRGDIQILGVASYAAPLLSTLALILSGRAEATPILVLSSILITGGAALAARASLSKP
jgi:drug/metabolite transporter (DMT)-like permease